MTTPPSGARPDAGLESLRGGRLYTHHSWPRLIAHADMDAFYAAAEQLDNPALRGVPVLIGSTSGRGVVLTASYEARPYNVGSAMPMAEALKRCPHAQVVPPRFERYTELSEKIMAVFREFSPRVEALSLDEAFVDMTGAEHLFGPPQAIGRRIKEAVLAATGLTISVGVSATKYVAKVASAHDKPNGLTVVPPEEAKAWLATLPVSRLWGAGPKNQQRLTALGYQVIGDVASADPLVLRRQLGNLGLHFFALANARDPRTVTSGRHNRSMGSDRTLTHDVQDPSEIAVHLRRSAERIARRLRAKNYVAGGIRVRLKTTDFRLLSRQCTLRTPTDTADELFAAARTLQQRFNHPGPFRLVGMAATQLQRDAEQRQYDLLAAHSRKRVLEGVLDEVALRFPSASLNRGNDVSRQTLADSSPTLDHLSGDPDL